MNSLTSNNYINGSNIRFAASIIIECSTERCIILRSSAVLIFKAIHSLSIVMIFRSNSWSPIRFSSTMFRPVGFPFGFKYANRLPIDFLASFHRHCCVQKWLAARLLIIFYNFINKFACNHEALPRSVESCPISDFGGIACIKYVVYQRFELPFPDQGYRSL